MELNQMPPHARVWIYQSTTLITPEQTIRIKQRGTEFLKAWTSHGHEMQAVLEVLHRRFVVICLDEQAAAASGCGIDKLLRFIQNLEQECALSLLDRMHIAWMADDNVEAVTMSEFRTFIQNSTVNGNTLVFNNLIETKAQLDTSWILPLAQSWQSRLLTTL